MKITKAKLKQIIKEELEAVTEVAQFEGGPEVDIQDAIQMLESELEMQDSYPDEYQSGTVFHVIGRLSEALAKLTGESDKGKESPDDIIHQDEHGNVIYRWQKDEFDEHQAAWKDFMKRNKK